MIHISMKNLFLKLLCLSIFIFSCQKTDTNPTVSKCYISKLTLTTKTTVPANSTSYSYNIENDGSQRISKVSNAFSVINYAYETNKVTVKYNDIVSGKTILKSTNTLVLNSKSQITQSIIDTESEKKFPNYAPSVKNYEYNDKGFVGKIGSISVIYEYNTSGLPSKISYSILNTERYDYDYYDEYKPEDFPNLETIYDYKSIGSFNMKPYSKLVKSIKYYNQNVLRKESLFTYTTFTDKKIKSITQIDYNYTNTGVKINTPTTSIQEFEYQCK
jgi:hypothetical protein